MRAEFASRRIALMLARSSGGLIGHRLWTVSWTTGYILTWAGWHAVSLRWLLAPCFLVVVVSLVTRLRLRPAKMGGEQ